MASRTHWIVGSLAAGLIVAASTSALLWAQEPTPDAPDNPANEAALMRAKVASSQKVLEGLVDENFDLIRDGAKELVKITDATQWHAEEDQVYAHYRADLRRTALKLALLAEERNLDGAAYTYMHSITTCISCHDYCRDVLHIADAELRLRATPKSPSGGAATGKKLRR
ncbi:MAG: hypothetical protein K2Y37_11390 [Pirellulales bacterium]|nr:hypothetical protein [Pirellulales bacterium]